MERVCHKVFFPLSFNFDQLSLSSRFPLILSLLISSCLISFLPNFLYFLQLSIVCCLTGSTFQPFESSTGQPREPTEPSTSETKRWISDGISKYQIQYPHLISVDYILPIWTNLIGPWSLSPRELVASSPG